MLYNATNIEKIFDKKKTSGGLLSKKSKIYCVKLPGSIVSQLKKDNFIEAIDIPQLETFEAGVLFAQTEGIIPAPESTHAIASAIREAKMAKEEGIQKVILFNLSGHGLVDMSAYDQYLAGDLKNYEISTLEIEKYLQD